MVLDASVLLFVSILVRLAASGIALLAWIAHRDVVCLLGWSAAMFLSATAMWVSSFRGAGIALPVTLMANVLFLAGYTLMWASMRRFNDDRLTLLRQALSVLAVAGAFALLFLLAGHLGLPRRAQSALFALFIAGLTLAAAWETWRGFRHDGLRSRHIAAGALVCIAATRLVRVGLIAMQSAGLVAPRTAELVQSYTLYVNVLFLLVATAGLVLMAQERVDRSAPRPS
ncbi:MAG: hypothetical protein EXR12_04250 [Rhodospirillaceae bacterium]|nr:hypothetical protein [Rhodospirillaceae bacterium]